MTGGSVLWAALLFLGGAADLALAAVGWRRRDSRGAASFVLLTVTGAIWSLGYGTEIVAPTLGAKALAVQVQYFGIVFLPLAWLLFAAESTGRDRWATRLQRALLAVVPVGILVLACTNSLHRLLWTELLIAPGAPFAALVVGRGPAYWANAAYGHALAAIGTVLLLWGIGRAQTLYRRQALLLVLTALVPYAANAIYLLAPSLTGGVDLTPFGFAVSAAALGWGLLRLRLLEVVPVAREAVLEGIGEGVFVLDGRGRVADANPEAERIAGRPAQALLGEPITSIVGEHPALQTVGGDGAESRAEVRLVRDGEARHFAARVFPLRGRRRHPLAWVLTLADITARVEAERALQHANQRIEALHGAALRIAQARDEADVFRQTVGAAEEILAFSMCGLYVARDGRLVVVATSSGLPPGVIRDVPLEAGGLAARTYRTGETVVFVCPADVPELLPTERPVRSGISAAIGRLGVFQVASDRERDFTRADGRLLELLLGHTEEAIRRLRLEKELRENALRDALTGVYNRRYLQDAMRQGPVGRVGLLMVDIDRLKEINDLHGHAVGDRVLQAVGEVLKENVRERDFVVRYGGDEFLVVLPDAREDVEQVAERVRAAFAAWSRQNPIGSRPITASVGVAQWVPDGEGGWERILEEADRRMYAMKAARGPSA